MGMEYERVGTKFGQKMGIGFGYGISLSCDVGLSSGRLGYRRQ